MQFEPCQLEHWAGLPSYGGIDWNYQFTKGGLSSYLCPRYFVYSLLFLLFTVINLAQIKHRITDAIELGGSYNTELFKFLKI